MQKHARRFQPKKFSVHYFHGFGSGSFGRGDFSGLLDFLEEKLFKGISGFARRRFCEYEYQRKC